MRVYPLVVLSTWTAMIPGYSQVPKMWDDAAMATMEVPLAEASASPKFPPADYYYRIPVRPIYKSYPAYAPGHEPAGYLDWLKQQEPVIIWDDVGHAPPLKTEADWIKAGEIVFDAPILFNDSDARDPARYEKMRIPVAKDQYVIRKKGVIEVGAGGCAGCHSRLMPNGTVLKGAQANSVSPQRVFAYRARRDAAAAKDREQFEAQIRLVVKTRWSNPDPEGRIDHMSLDDIVSYLDSFPPSVGLRARANLFYSIQIPDLIGVKERHFLDHTGLEVHRSIGDLMRYIAMNQGADYLASYAGFVPADAPRFQQLPAPEKSSRYSEQLYALTLYLYSLQPPPNPNKFDGIAARGQRVFEREGCGGCHTPPLYTNNKLTPAEGFTIPEDHLKKYDILPIPVGTDPNLTLKTRRGTGYYKVPSLKGLWYRNMFPHDGSCATLEDWFDPRRLGDDYVPTGFKGYQVTHRAVPGHEFGLKVSLDDKRALIAFLKTL
jgi:mono/diheme cytochrome c family protein